MPGWAFGTFLGVVSGNIFPPRVLSALGVALYSMFIAIIIPPEKENKIISAVVFISMVLSLIFTKLPLLSQISSGFRIIIITVIIAGAAAAMFPVREKTNEE